MERGLIEHKKAAGWLYTLFSEVRPRERFAGVPDGAVLIVLDRVDRRPVDNSFRYS
jgi:hypothetical protein